MVAPRIGADDEDESHSDSTHREQSSTASSSVFREKERGTGEREAERAREEAREAARQQAARDVEVERQRQDLLAEAARKRDRSAAVVGDRDFGDESASQATMSRAATGVSTNMYHKSILQRQKRLRRTELADVKEAVRKGFREEVARVEATTEREEDVEILTSVLVDAAGAALAQFEPVEQDLSRLMAAVQTLKVYEEGRRARRTALLAVLDERRRVQMELASVRADLEWTRAQRQRVAALNALSADLQTAHEAGAAVVLLDTDAITDAPSFTTSIESLVALTADHAAEPTTVRATTRAMREFLAAAGDRDR
jgi:hypothetical protein